MALLYAQLTHSIGLNDVCDALRLHASPLASIRGTTPPSRNNLSPADKVRPAQLAEKLFWAGFQHLRDRSPRFVSGQAGKRFARRFAFQNLSKTLSGVAERQRSEVQRRAVAPSAPSRGSRFRW